MGRAGLDAAVTEHHRTSEWQRARAQARPRIAAALPLPCIDCHQPVRTDQKWQVGHRTPVSVAKRMGWTPAQINAPENLGPTHAKAPGQKACNQIAGGKLGASRTNQKRRDERRLFPW